MTDSALSQRQRSEFPASVDEVPPALARTWFLASAVRPQLLSDAFDSAADAIVIDIEDAVLPADKDEARQDTASLLSEGRRAWVRINGRGSEFWDEDVRVLRQAPGLQGVILAKAEHAEEVADTRAALGGGAAVIPLIESAAGLLRVESIAAAEGVTRLAFGTGDFQRDTGLAATPASYAYARSRITVAAAAAGLPGSIDGSVRADEPVGIAAHAATSLEFGFTGTLVLRPSQVAILNGAYSPKPAELARATTLLAEFEASGGRVNGGDDLPRLAVARRLVDRARALGLV